MERKDKKALIDAYKQKKGLGGVFLIENTKTGRAMLLPSPDLEGTKNRFAFARESHTAMHLSITDWGDGSNFTITLLDSMELEREWDRQRVRDELAALTDLWHEKLGDRLWY